MKRRPEWLDLPPHGDDCIAVDSKFAGATMACYNPDTFRMKKRLIYWSETDNQHYYGRWVDEDSPLFHGSPIIHNPIRP